MSRYKLYVHGLYRHEGGFGFREETLLAVSCRREFGYSLFSPETIARIQFIPWANELGFSLKEIAHLLTLGVDRETPCGDVKHRAGAKIIEYALPILKRRGGGGGKGGP